MSSHASDLVALAEGIALWRSTLGEPFATIPVAGHLEHWPLDSSAFKEWLSRQFYQRERVAPNAQALVSALSVLRGRAVHEGETHPVFTRVGELDGLLYLDLGDDQWRAVEIAHGAWQVVKSHEVVVRFRRSRSMRPLLVPERGGSIEDLRRYVNVRRKNPFTLICAWLIGALRPYGPYPVLCLHGEQGSAKSTLARILRSLIDPNGAPLRAAPKDLRDLVLTARNGRVVALDNLSHLPEWLSDAICRLSTGGGFSTRSLYTDGEEFIHDGQSPVVMTGIEELATRGDLLDRSIPIVLDPIPEGQRRTEADVLQSFEEVRPRILGAILDAVAQAHLDEQEVKLERLPRMADFARWACAAAPAMPWSASEFLAAYDESRREANGIALEASPVAQAITRLLEMRPVWEGTLTELLGDLEKRIDEEMRRTRSWPKSPRGLSSALRRLAPNLRVAGVEVEFTQTGGSGSRKMVRLHHKLAEFCDATDACDAADAGPSSTNPSDADEPEEHF